MKLTPAVHNSHLRGIALTMAALCVLAFPAAGFSWTSVGPWGGVIHDLEAAAGGNTLFAGTANGLYMRNVIAGSDTWTSFENTTGFRVLQVLPDPDGERVYAVIRGSGDAFDFEEPAWTGYLYELDISSPSGSFEQIFGVDDPATMGTDETLAVSSLALCGEGDLLVTTFDEVYEDMGGGEYTVGYVYRKQAGSVDFGSAVDPGWYTLLLPIRAVLGQAGSDTVFLIRSSGDYSDIVRSDNCGSTSWWPSERGTSAYNTLTGGAEPTSLGYGAGGEVLFGTEDGKVFRRVSSGSWELYGSGLPPYPVVDFGKDLPGRTVAVLREDQWNVSLAADPAAGAWYLDGGTWKPKGVYNYVSSKVREVLPVGSTEWVAYDLSGLWRYPNGTGTGVQSDSGIAAVDLEGIVLDPRSDRALAFGPSGMYERRDRIWSRLVMSYVGTVLDTNDDLYDAMQNIRDDRYMSAAFDTDGETIWLGSSDSGLIRGTLLSEDPPSYRFDQRHLGDASGDRFVSDILADPFDGTVYFTKSLDGEGIYRTQDGGLTFSSMTGHLNTNASYYAVRLATDLLRPEERTLLVGINSGQTQVPGLLYLEGGGTFEESDLYMNQMVGGVAFNPFGLGTKKAVAGPDRFCVEGMAIMGTEGTWVADSSVAPPSGLPAAWSIRSLKIPLGIDGDDQADAFAVAHQNGTPFMGLFHSVADTWQGSPGASWTEITGDIEPFGPTSVTVDPKDGNLLWITTRNGSAFTLYGDHYTDDAAPFIPLKPTVTGSTTGDTLRTEVGSIAADTVSTRTSLPLLKMTAKVTNTIDLEWLAPGDDGDFPGWADRYELYYSSQPITDSNDLGTAWTTSLPAPNVALYPEAFSLDVAAHADSWFSVALVAYDEGDRASVLQTVSTAYNFDDGLTDIDSIQIQIEGSFDKVAAVKVYRDGNGNGTFEVPGDVQVGSSSSVSALMTVPLSLSPVGGTEQTLFVVCDLASLAESGDAVNVGITELGIEAGDEVSSGTLPAWSGTVRVVALEAETGGGSGGGGGGGCFIATAAYGNAMEPEVDLLRGYRDGYLVYRWWGRALLKAYYTLSPVPAAFIAERPVLRQGARLALSPIIAVVKTDGSGCVPAVVGFLLVGIPLTSGGLMIYGFVGIIRRRGVRAHGRGGAWESEPGTSDAEKRGHGDTGTRKIE